MTDSLMFTRKEGSQIRVPLQTPTINPRLELRDGQFLWVYTNGEGGLHEKFMSSAAVREVFGGVAVDTGWMNEEATSPVVCRSGDGKGGPWAVLYVPPASHTIELTNDGSGEAYAAKKITAPLPGIALFGITCDYYAFALKGSKLEPYHEIQRCPLPNVMENGIVCWGLIPPPRATPQTMLEAWRLFIGSTFNNHAAAAKSKRHRADVREVLKEMAMAPQPSQYPVSDLVRQHEPGGMSLDRAVREFFETAKMPGK